MITPARVAGQSNRGLIEPERGVADYSARRSYAYAVGEEVALRRTISADAYLFLYKELVRLCKERTYCWAGVDWLARRLETSTGTVKRWLTQLVSAGLIQRKPRPGGDTALTMIPALAAYDDEVAARQAGTHCRMDNAPLEGTEVSVTYPHVAPPSEASFFVPSERIVPESNAGSIVSRHTVKKHDPNPGSVGLGADSNETSMQAEPQEWGSESPVIKRLVEAGVADPGVLHELRNTPLAEIDIICRYVATQPNTYNPPGLIVALTRTGMGAALLRQGHQNGCRSRPQRRQRAARQRALEAGLTLPDPTVHPSGTVIPNEWSQLWITAQQLLVERLPETEYAAWFADTKLISHKDGQAVIGVPNVFARESLDLTYRQVISDVLLALTGSSPAVQIVID